jgi:hypothetical protein
MTEQTSEEKLAGDEFDVRLEAMSGGGYRWTPAPLPDGVTLIGDDYERDAAAAPGDPVRHIFRFRAARGDPFTLRFDLKRPWESSAVRTHEVRVTKR